MKAFRLFEFLKNLPSKQSPVTRGDETHRLGRVFFFASIISLFVALYTGNNLLFLLAGLFFGVLVGSLFLGTQMLSGIEINRRTPPRSVAEKETRVSYTIENKKRWLPSISLQVKDPSWQQGIYYPLISAGSKAEVSAMHSWPKRGSFKSEGVELDSTAPLHIRNKKKRIPSPTEIIIHPRSDLPIRQPNLLHGSGNGQGHVEQHVATHDRGEFRSLRDYQPGDDMRDVHWAATARHGRPITREYETYEPPHMEIHLDVGEQGLEEESKEQAISIAATLAMRLASENQRVLVRTHEDTLGPDNSDDFLVKVLDHLALLSTSESYKPLSRVDISNSSSPSILVTTSISRLQGDWTDRYIVPDEVQKIEEVS